MTLHRTLERLPDWENKWLSFIKGIAGSPLVWGQDDCMLMCGRNIEVLTGADYYSEHIGSYSTEVEAFRYLALLGWRLPEHMMAEILPEIPVAFAQRGDILLFEHCLGISLGARGLFKGVNGLTGDQPEFVKTLSAQKAWRVG